MNFIPPSLSPSQCVTSDMAPQEMQLWVCLLPPWSDSGLGRTLCFSFSDHTHLLSSTTYWLIALLFPTIPHIPNCSKSIQSKLGLFEEIVPKVVFEIWCDPRRVSASYVFPWFYLRN